MASRWPQPRLALALLPLLAAAAWSWPGSAASRTEVRAHASMPAGIRTIAALPLASLAPSASASAPPAAAEAGKVQRSGAAWAISPGDASRTELAQQLATQSGSRVYGELAVLQALPRLHVAAHGLDLEGAWRLLLGGSSNHAMHCSAQACTVWLIGPPPAGGGANQAASALAAPADPPGLFPAELPPEPA